MLFRTVFGPELSSILNYIQNAGAATQLDLTMWFLQSEPEGNDRTNLEEALAFLSDLGLLRPDREQLDLLVVEPGPFSHRVLLTHLQACYRVPRPDAHPLDPWFMGVLDHLFIRPDRTFIPRLHTAVNALPLPTACSEEKVNAWRRVMEALGCGWRAGSGFLACYRPELLMRLLEGWTNSGPLEEFLDHVEHSLPVRTATGGLATCFALPLLHLEERGTLRLTQRGDYAGRAFFGERRIKWITVEG